MGLLQAGMMLGGRYRIVRELGAGGMSTVYLADDLRLKGKRWAVKEQRCDPRDAGRFKAEAEMMIRLDHVHLPHIVDFFPPNPDGCSYVVMDYIEGVTLLQWFESRGRRAPAEQLAVYASQICELFHYLHEYRPEPIIYRDLKPSNVMLDGSGHVKLVDFGIARSYKQGGSADTVKLGTIGFAAPEQLEGRQSDARTDLYSLGAMMYYLLSGGQHYYAAQKSLRVLKPELPAGMAAVVDKLLRANPAERFQSALEAKRALDRCLAGSEDARREGAPPGSPAAVPKLIVVGALYAGAGATFTALALAKALEAKGAASAVIEFAAGAPELYALLFGRARAPEGYRFYAEEAASSGPAWEDGLVAWYPERPGGSGRPGWSAEKRVRLFYRMKKPFIVADIGTAWSVPEARELLEEADAVVAVFDPLVYKLEAPEHEGRLREVEGWREKGKRVGYIANKSLNAAGRKDWLALLPRPADCLLPAVDFAHVVESCWQGTLVHNRPDVKRMLTAALEPLTAQWLPPSKSGRWLRALRRAGIFGGSGGSGGSGSG